MPKRNPDGLTNVQRWLNFNYNKIVNEAIEKGLITQEEWETKFKFYRDQYGHSFVHLLECRLHDIGFFITLCPVILENRQELQGKFQVKIMTPLEFGSEA